LLAEIRAALDSAEFIAAHRARSTDFTRRRTLTFATLVTSLARGLTRSLQGELPSSTLLRSKGIIGSPVPIKTEG
jgi:hypothetical protein